MRGIIDRLTPWWKWKRRALTAERTVIALRELFAEAKGMSVDEYMIFKNSMIWVENPRHSVKITGIEVPDA